MQRTILILACFFVCANSFAQQYPFVHYTPKDGLVNSRVKKAYQDSKGRMYFLTYGGLSMYDGARFKNLTTQNGLPNNIINDILEIGDDSILVATNSNHINLLTKGKIEAFKTKDNFTPLVNHFYRHDDKRVYLSSDFGLYVLDKNNIHELKISGISGQNEQPNLGNIAGVGNFLVISTNDMSFNKGVYLYDLKNNRICDSLATIRAHLIGKDEKNRIWISTADQLLIVDNVALQKGKISLIPPDKGYQQTKNYSTINIAFGKDHAWFVYRKEESRNSELRRIDEEGNILQVNLPIQTTVSYLKSMFIDKENNIWLCNDGEGVFKVIRSSLQIIEKPFGTSVEDHAGYIYYNNNTTWYTTATKKIFRQTPKKLQAFTCNIELSPYIFYQKGNYILANDNHSIYEAQFSDQTKILNFKKIVSLPDSDVFGKLRVDPNGGIIASHQSGLGVWLNNKLIFHLSIKPKEHIEDLFIDSSKRLWVINRSEGITVYNFQPDNFVKYLQPLFHIPQEQMPGSVRSFTIDKKGMIWIGTRDRGLAGYSLKGSTLEKKFHFLTENGLSDNFVTSLACDSLNNIIAGTQMGLDLVLYHPGNKYRVEKLSRNSNHFAYIHSTWADTAYSYALTNSGVILKVTTSAIGNKNQSPQLLLEEMKVNGLTTLRQTGHFNFKENNISFFVAAPSFVDEKQIRYTYLLQGSGNVSWSDTTAANSIINLINLSSGEYILKVKAFFHSDAYIPSELTYPFEITPPWWQTWWFRVIAGLLIIGLLIIGFRFYYRRKLEKQMAVLEKQQAIEKERTRIATDMHDDLGAGLSRIKFLSETIGIKKQQDQPIEEDISKIREYSHEMIDKMGEIVWALNEKNDSLSDLLSYTRSYAVEYLSQNGIDCKTEMPDSFPSVFVSGEFRRNIFLILKEALHNIVKHAQATEVNLIINVNQKLSIQLQDNGTGFDKNNIRPFSNGLSNMESRAKEIGGNFEIAFKGGTMIKLSVPLNV